MRTSRTLTAIGWMTLATGAIIGGAVVTSSAMASETTPDEGTSMVVLVNEGDSDAIVCVYPDMHDIEPAVDEAHAGDFATDVGHGREIAGDAVHAQARPGTAEECGAAREELVAP